VSNALAQGDGGEVVTDEACPLLHQGSGQNRLSRSRQAAKKHRPPLPFDGARVKNEAVLLLQDNRDHDTSENGGEVRIGRMRGFFVENLVAAHEKATGIG
jgi:hypothetical protein